MRFQFDPDALAREFEAKIASLPPPALDGEYIPASSSAEWDAVLSKYAIVEKLHNGLAPNWQVDDGDREAVREATAELLTRYWPGGPLNADRWGPWAKLSFALFCIALANFDEGTGRMRPRGLPEPQPEQPAAAQPQEPQT